MIIGIITNESKDEGLAYTHEIYSFLQARGASPVMGPAPDAVFWVVPGGDGTMLRAACRAAVHNIPMLGINLGTLGYLTDVDKHEGLSALEKALQGKYKRENRLMLEADGGKRTAALHPADTLALNDVYISHGGLGRLIKLDIYVNGLLIDSLRADGIIIATPTGSTAYSLSAGGPILMPEGDMMIITAVCPHNLYTRPWVINPREVRIMTHHPATAALDGETRLHMEAGDQLTVRRSPLNTTILKTSDLHFFDVLRRKMSH